MLSELVSDIKRYAQSIGLSDIGISDVDLSDYSKNYQRWINKHYHGDMDYMTKHGDKRWIPEKLINGTIRVISFRLDYWTENNNRHYVAVPKQFDSHKIDPHPVLSQTHKAYISRYALGRDYHKVLRKKGKALSEYINQQLKSYDSLYESVTSESMACEKSGSKKIGKDNSFNFRVFVDSGPVLEKPLAEKAGLGWIGKHSNLINDEKGSWFFLGEIYTNLPLPIDNTAWDNTSKKESMNKPANHCGSCTRCIQACPTNAIVEPYVVDANLCISYLTIEHKKSIPIELRSPMGNRIYGCDDCQLVCPWNKFTELSQVNDFSARHGLDNIDLLQCFLWDETTFLEKTEGSAIRRIGYLKWLSNIAIALGNADFDETIMAALQEKMHQYSHQNQVSNDAMAVKVLLEHTHWAISEQTKKKNFAHHVK